MLSSEGNAFTGRSQREEVAGAAEVQEESELEVELPIDQVQQYSRSGVSASPPRLQDPHPTTSCLLDE